MSFSVYDYRTVNRNVLVTPEIRARLYHMKPGQVDGRHSHDLGHEVFLILEGKAEFNIGGHREVLGPGQMCVARADGIHQVRNLLDDAPTIMYLSVTPHVQPTHTGRTDTDEKVPYRFPPNEGYDDPAPQAPSLPAALDAYLQAARQLRETAQELAEVSHGQVDAWREAAAQQDSAGPAAARGEIWQALYALHKQLSILDAAWNDLAPRGDRAQS